jgi:hypothetical protein
MLTMLRLLGRRARRCRRAARTPGRPRRGRSMPTTKDFKLEVSAAQFAPSAQAPASSSGRRFRCSSAPPSRGCHGCGGAHESAGPDVVCARMQELSKYFHLPEKAVAKELGICLTSLKKVPSDPSFCAPACAPAAVMRSSAVEHARALTGCCVPPCAALPVVWHHSVAIPQGEDGVSCPHWCCFAAGGVLQQAVCCSRRCVPRCMLTAPPELRKHAVLRKHSVLCHMSVGSSSPSNAPSPKCKMKPLGLQWRRSSWPQGSRCQATKPPQPQWRSSRRRRQVARGQQVLLPRRARMLWTRRPPAARTFR